MSHSEDINQLKLILQGEKPSVVLNRILTTNPGLDKHDLASIFLEEFCLLDSKALPLIWHWKSIKSARGISDEQFDDSILVQMREAGYFV
ncbi:hypothetical protein [Acinetobacter tjernbergiae]|jgi:hypothetical protein|uniref:Uncharacterized protein n=1 Tax=Acinetobacter tjernbergiae DSM 14971 = CIP 107465 TaxID=1120928 RepID=V2V2U4_9GAMM|nr:hypothetical protein [Acinetobacter tjernbergiae]ESK55245.1 hypothetical protein F990_02034 [Acinetobacter tjernbergiae DSM 14971 = CIP 107465]